MQSDIRVLVVSEPDLRSINKATLGILGKLSGVTKEVAVFGDLEPDVIDHIRQYDVTRINLLKGDTLKDRNPEACLLALMTFMESCRFDIVISGTSSTTCDIFPALSVRFGSGFAADVDDFQLKDEKLSALKELYGGQCLADVEFSGDKPWFMTVNSGALTTEVCKDNHDCEIIEHDVSAFPSRIRICKITKLTSSRPPLKDADIVVAGGRGLGEPGSLRLLEELADTMGASLGASGGAIGDELAPQECLVGQSGTRISPMLYIACGISGATQHLAGIRNAKKILAINTDPDTPLMRIADYAVIGDLNDIVPAMTRILSADSKDK